MVVGGLRLLNIEICAVLPCRIQQPLTLNMVIQVLQLLIDQFLDPARYTLLVIFVMVLQLVALLLEFVKLHQAGKGLIEVEYLLARLVGQLLVRLPDVLGPVTDDHQERFDLGNRPYLLLLVLDHVVKRILLQILRLHINIDRQVRVDVPLYACDFGKVLLVPRDLLLLFLVGLLRLVILRGRIVVVIIVVAVWLRASQFAGGATSTTVLVAFVAIEAVL